MDSRVIREISRGIKRVSATVPDLNHVLDYPFNVLHGYKYEFLKELREYFENDTSNDYLNIIIIESSKRNQIDSILQGLAFNLNVVYDKESLLDNCSISGVRSILENTAVSVAPGLFHITHMKYLNLILEQSSTGQPSKKDKDSIEIRLVNAIKESIGNLEQTLIGRAEKLYMFIETDRLSEILPELRQL